jgi:hypothetical protein
MKEVLHDVHILAVVRVLVKDVPAKSPKQAILKAQEKVNLDKLLKQRRPLESSGAACVEFNDDIIGFILDAKVGEKIAGTGVYDAHGKPTTLDSPIR